MPSLTTPDGWEPASEQVPGTDLVVLEPVDPAAPDRFRANLVLSQMPNGPIGFADWQTGTDELLAQMLERYAVLDLERRDIEGYEGGRRLAHHAGPGGEALVLEQWFFLVDGVGHTLSATVGAERYDELADVLASAAETWEPWR